MWSLGLGERGSDIDSPFFLGGVCECSVEDDEKGEENGAQRLHASDVVWGWGIGALIECSGPKGGR